MKKQMISLKAAGGGGGAKKYLHRVYLETKPLSDSSKYFPVYFDFINEVATPYTDITTIRDVLKTLYAGKDLHIYQYSYKSLVPVIAPNIVIDSKINSPQYLCYTDEGRVFVSVVRIYPSSNWSMDSSAIIIYDPNGGSRVSQVIDEVIEL